MGDFPNYESNPEPVPVDLNEAQVSGGVIVMASVIPVNESTFLPSLIFRFAKVDGSGFWPPIVLAVENATELRELRPLINAAVHDACEAVKRMSR